MGSELFDLNRQVHDVLLKEWDSIGIQEHEQAQDEYDSYVPRVCALLLHGASHKEVFAYLWKVETVAMGLRGEKQRTQAVAKRLVDLGNK